MLKRARLLNFQSHSDSVIDFSDNITSIVGLSDSGKSAFLRSLKCILYRDKFYLRNFQDSGKIELELSDGNIAREVEVTFPKKCPECKGSINKTQKCPHCNTLIEPDLKVDRYIVNGEIKDKFGRSLPESIKDFIRFHETSFVDFKIKLQLFSQHEDMFFIGPTYAGGARNKIMSCLIPDSEKIDLLLKRTIADAQEKKILAEALLTDNAALELKIESGKSLADEIKDLDKEVLDATSRSEVISKKIERLRSIQKELEMYGKRAKYLSKIQVIEDNLKKIRDFIDGKIRNTSEKIQRLRSLSNLPKHYSEYEEPKSPSIPFERMEELQRKIVRLRSLSNLPKYQEYNEPKSPVIEFGRMEELQRKIGRLSSVNTQLVEAFQLKLKSETIQKELECEISKRRSQYNDTLGKSMCPVTGDKYCDSCVEKLKL